MGYIILESYPIFQYYSSIISHKIDTGIFYWNKHGVILKNSGIILEMFLRSLVFPHRWPWPWQVLFALIGGKDNFRPPQQRKFLYCITVYVYIYTITIPEQVEYGHVKSNSLKLEYRLKYYLYIFNLCVYAQNTYIYHRCTYIIMCDVFYIRVIFFC